VLAFEYARSLWYPIYVKVTGAQTISSAIESIKTQTEPEYSDYQALQILGFKTEQHLEVWATNHSGQQERLANFPFTGYSGQLGPKLREGDGQIPEGIYTIEYLNPNSNYHLSMKINYPNAFDQKKGSKTGGID
jgi:murein L,D-transpeptidase YafK